MVDLAPVPVHPLPSTPPAPIPFVDLKAQQARIRARVEARWSQILDHGRYIQGPEVEELEQALCAATGAADVVAVGSGTDALIMGLMALGVGVSAREPISRTAETSEDAVFIPAFTYNATANAVLLAGATPVFVDVDPDTFNMDPTDLARRIAAVRAEGRLTPRAVIPVDLYGLPADIPAIEAAADGLAILIDGAQSFGGRLDGKAVGGLGPMTTTSFYPAKALGTYGDGGALFVNDANLAAVLRSIRWHGTCACKQESIRVGFNGRLDSLNCAVVTEKLRIFGDELARRTEIAAIYENRLEGVVDFHRPRPGQESGYGLFTIAVRHRDRVAAALKADGVPTAVYYRQALHHMGAFAAYAPDGGLPAAEMLASRVLSLPMHPYLSDAQAHYVCDRVTAAVG